MSMKSVVDLRREQQPDAIQELATWVKKWGRLSDGALLRRIVIDASEGGWVKINVELATDIPLMEGVQL